MMNFPNRPRTYTTIPQVTTTQRDLLRPHSGMGIYNTTTGTAQNYKGVWPSGEWIDEIYYVATKYLPGPSDTLRNSNDTERTTSSVTYVKLKETKVNASLEGARIKFDLGTNNTNGTAYGRIYKNGAVLGGEWSKGDTTDYVTNSQDFLTLNLVANDLIQLYAKNDGGWPTRVRNLRFYYDNQIITIGGDTLSTTLVLATTAISMTEQDP